MKKIDIIAKEERTKQQIMKYETTSEDEERKSLAGRLRRYQESKEKQEHYLTGTHLQSYNKILKNDEEVPKWMSTGNVPQE